MKRLGFLALMAFICIGTMGPGTCASTGEESPSADPQGGSVAGNADTDWGGSQAGNPEGGSVAQNPVEYRVIKGFFATIKVDDGQEQCEFQNAVLVNDELEHTVAVVDPVDCTFEQQWPVGEPMALVGVKGKQQEFSVGDLDERIYQIIGPGPALQVGESAQPIDLGLITENAETARLEPQYPIKEEDLISASGSDSDGDGIPDAYDDFNNDWYYGFYEPGQLISNVAVGADHDVNFCPPSPETVKVQVKKWFPKEGSTHPHATEVVGSNGVELVIHYQVDGKDARERTFGTIGTVEAGFIKTGGNKYVGDTIYSIECRGWLTHEEPHPADQLTLRIGCYYRLPNASSDAAACVYWDYVKMLFDLKSITKDDIDVTQPINQAPVQIDDYPEPLMLPQGPSSGAGPSSFEPYVFP